MMQLTVGIPVHGAISSFKRTFEALQGSLRQLRHHTQIVVVNDFSNEDDSRKLATWLQPFDNVVLLHTDMCTEGPNPNLGLAMNMARRLVRPQDDYFLNLESDVLVSGNALIRLCAVLDDDPTVPAVFPAMKTPDGQYDFVFWNRGLLGALPEDLSLPRRCTWGNVGCLLVRGSVARIKTIRVDEQFKLWCADGDYTCSIYKETGHASLYTPRAEVIHFGRQSTQEGSGKYDDLIADAVNTFDNKWADLLSKGCLL